MTEFTAFLAPDNESVTFRADNLIQAMAHANLAGYGDRVSAWQTPSGLTYVGHEPGLTDVHWTDGENVS